MPETPSPPAESSLTARHAYRGAADIRIERLNKHFGQFVAVGDLSLHIAKGEFVTFLGPSGSGKTTTLMLVAGFLFPTSGDILVGGDSIVSRPAHKRNIGIVFQNYSLFPHMTIRDNIAFPLKMRKVSRVDIDTRVTQALDLVELSDFGGRFPKQLSGGQQQRVALARALVFDPPILLMDEPLGALDKNLRESMQLEIKHLQDRLNITTIYVTHDQSEALTMSDRIVVMNHGRVEQVGGPEDLYERPANRFVASFIGESNFLEGRIERTTDEWVEVAADGAMVTRAAKEDACTTGQSVCVALRPERIAFFVDQDAPEGWSCLEGVIEEEIYIGDLIRYEVRLPNGQALSVKHSNKTTRTRRDHELYRRGATVTVGWNWRDAKIVSESGDTATP